MLIQNYSQNFGVKKNSQAQSEIDLYHQFQYLEDTQ